ncbi:MAG: hypothetical protein DRJ33_07565, partial [Candidatus Methanomethylicota archaeon]
MRKELAKSLRGSKKVLLLCHKNADPDAVCSAIVLENYISKILKKETACTAVEGISAISKKVLESLGFEEHFRNIDDLNYYDTIILVDTGSLDQVKPLDEQLIKGAKKLIVVDHHHENEKLASLSSLYIVDSSSPSTAEIVYRILSRSIILKDAKMCQALLIGIIYDSRRFALASYNTLRTVLNLMKKGADYD